MNSFINVKEIQNFRDKYEVTFEEPKICVMHEGKQWYRIGTTSHVLSTREWVALLIKTLVTSIFTLGFGKDLKENWSTIFSWKATIILHVEEKQVEEVISLYLPKFNPFLLETDDTPILNQNKSSAIIPTKSNSDQPRENAPSENDAVKRANPIAKNSENIDIDCVVDPLLEKEYKILKKGYKINYNDINSIILNNLSLQELTAFRLVSTSTEAAVKAYTRLLPAQLVLLIEAARLTHHKFTF